MHKTCDILRRPRETSNTKLPHIHRRHCKAKQWTDQKITPTEKEKKIVQGKKDWTHARNPALSTKTRSKIRKIPTAQNKPNSKIPRIQHTNSIPLPYTHLEAPPNSPNSQKNPTQKTPTKRNSKRTTENQRVAMLLLVAEHVFVILKHVLGPRPHSLNSKGWTHSQNETPGCSLRLDSTRLPILQLRQVTGILLERCAIQSNQWNMRFSRGANFPDESRLRNPNRRGFVFTVWPGTQNQHLPFPATQNQHLPWSQMEILGIS